MVSIMITEETIRKIVKEAVQETLNGMGFNVAHLQEVQADMHFLHNLRKSREELANKVTNKLALILLTGGAYLLWEAFKSKIMMK